MAYVSFGDDGCCLGAHALGLESKMLSSACIIGKDSRGAAKRPSANVEFVTQLTLDNVLEDAAVLYAAIPAPRQKQILHPVAGTCRRHTAHGAMVEPEKFRLASYGSEPS